MTQPIWYDSSEAGAPTLNNVAGSLLEVLRACLKNGFNTKTVTSIAVASGVATVTCAAHGFLGTYGKLVLISGSTEPLLNGNKQPGNVLTNSFTYPAPGVADGTYTGTLSAKRAPLGWTEPHSGTNKAIFARSAVGATAYMLRVNDSQVAPATVSEPRVLMIEGATDVDSYSIVAPTAAQHADGGRWYKGTPDATARRWVLVGNEGSFYLFLPSSATQTAAFHQYPVFFGDFRNYLAGDAHRCILAFNNFAFAVYGYPTCQLGYVANSYTSAEPSSAHGVRSARAVGGGALSQAVNTMGPATGGYMGQNSGQTTNTTMTVIGRPFMVQDNPSTFQIRGEWPGLANRLSAVAFDTVNAWSVVPGAEGDGRSYLEVRCMISGSVERSVMLDLTGPWYD